MPSPRRRPPTAVAAATTTVLAAALLSAATVGVAGSAVAAGPQPRPARGLAARPHTPLPTSGARPGSMLEPRVVAGTDGDAVASTRMPTRGVVQVMLELDAAPSATAYVSALGRGRSVAARAGRAQRTRVLAGQRAVVAAFGAKATAARTLYTTSSVYAGVAVTTDASRLPALERLPGVKAVHLLTPKRLANTSTVPLIGAPAAWTANGTGTGVRIGIIDTGIDFTHADFGGPGTTSAYDSAKADDTQAPTYPAGGNVVGGVDLAGDDYAPGATLADGSLDPGAQQPVPDPNPLDCEGHGSHVAGSTAGLGVTAAGATYRGPWVAGGVPADLRVGPGVAPGASLYAIKVFGCTGSTNLVTAALDWSADPNRDGDVSDHLDVVNMSLGGDFASPQDPDGVASDNLSRLGTVVVASAGNGGDLQDVGGAPGNATRTIDVAASDDALSVVDGLKVDAPAGIEPDPSLDGASDDVFGAEQSGYDWAGLGGVQNTPLVQIADWSAPPSATNNTDGCAPYSPAEAAAVAGKVVLLSWTDTGTRRCGSAVRGGNAVTAGAVGAVLADDVNSFSAGIAGDPRLPMMLVLKQGGDALSAAVNASRNDGSVRVSLTNAYQGKVRINLTGTSEDPTDRITSFSSRGFGTKLAVKPDVTGPGGTVFSAAVGTGADGVSESGTSMSAPHVAGVAALVRKAHPTWTVEQVKAAVVNTAGAKVSPELGGPLTEGPARAGSGRVQADLAVSTSTLAYGADGTGAVSLSFGDIAVSGDSRLTRGLRVENTTGAARTYDLAYQPKISTPGVSFSVSPSRVTVPAHGATKVVVTLRVTAAALRRTLDPTMSADQGLRSYYADAGGAVVVRSAGSTVTVPVYAAPRPASAMTSAATVAVGSNGNGRLDLVGRDVLQGSNPNAPVDPTVYASTVSALMLQGTSARGGDCATTTSLACTPFPEDRAGDLRYVGAASDAPYSPEAFNGADGADSGFAYFGVSTWGPWRTPASYAEFDVYVNTDAGVPGGSSEPELVLFNSRLSADSDTMVANLADLRTGEIVDVEPLNAALGSFDTGLFHSDTMVLPLWLPKLQEYLPKKADGSLASSRIGYWVESGTIESGHTDAIAGQTRPLSFDVKSPALRAAGDAGGPTLNDDAADPDFALAVHRDASRLAADRPLGLMLVHHQNLNGARAQVVRVGGSTTTRLSTTASSFTYPGRPTLTAAVASAVTVSGVAAPTGTVTFRDGTRVLGSAKVVSGKAVFRPTPLGRGTHAVTATYEGDGQWAPSRSAAVRLTVAGVRSTTSLTVSPTTYRFGGRPTATSVVAPASATGTVTISEGSRALVRGTLARGRTSLKVPVLSRGRHLLRATYSGSSVHVPSGSRVVTVVVR